CPRHKVQQESSIVETCRGMHQVPDSWKEPTVIAMECSSLNGTENPCTTIYRKDRWKLAHF
nr:probable flavin-containing monooxygenase 1 [Tanacetum cinerariifolium]